MNAKLGSCPRDCFNRKSLGDLRYAMYRNDEGQRGEVCDYAVAKRTVEPCRTVFIFADGNNRMDARDKT